MTEPEPDPEQRPEQPADDGVRDDPLRGSRTSGLWIALVVASVLLVLLIVFLAQNTEDVSIAFLAWEGETPLAVALLIAATGAAIITALAGTLRIWQLRRRVRRDRH